MSGKCLYIILNFHKNYIYDSPHVFLKGKLNIIRTNEIHFCAFVQAYLI